MHYTPSAIDGDSILVHQYSGALDPEGLRRIVQERGQLPGHQIARAFVVDLARAQVGHLSRDFIRELGALAAGVRRHERDYRPTFVSAPSTLTRGLANMFASYRGDAVLHVFESLEEAVAAARAYVGAHPADGPTDADE